MKPPEAKRNARRRGRKQDKPPVPPERLVPETRFGKARCQYWDRRRRNHNNPRSASVHFQCRQPARPGFAVCHYHGAGSTRRERQGTRQNPATAGISLGQSARPENVQALVDTNPELEERILYWREHPELLNFRPLVAMCRDLLNYYLLTADLSRTEMPNNSAPPILRAIKAARTLVEITDRLAAIEGNMRRLPRSEFERWKYAVGAGLARFVPAHQLDECRLYCERLLKEHSEPLPGRGPAGARLGR